MFFSPARHEKFNWAIRTFVLFVLTSAFGIPLSFAQPQATESPVPSVPILVSDFELFSVPAAAAPPAALITTPPATAIATAPATPISTPAATPLSTPPATAIATPAATPIATPPAIPISTPAATPLATPPAKAIATPPATPITPPATPIATPAVASRKQKPPLPLVNEDTDLPSVQARRLTNFFAATLVETLKKSGYNVLRTRGQLQPQGALLRGVFTEPDEKNRIRRALLGGTSANPKFLLYVGIFNLARPDQPLYQLAPEQSPSSQFGPIITLNTYIPLAKYELDKDPSEEDVRKICAQIVASLTALLAANAAAFSD
jgi:hypothetical protein